MSGFAQRCVVHLYALCWNEERLLPFFFQHYNPIVSRYFIYDHDSTDRSRQILKAHPNVTLRQFEVCGDSYVSSASQFYNHAWKQSISSTRTLPHFGSRA
jgi:Glycosyl transferase family 2